MVYNEPTLLRGMEIDYTSIYKQAAARGGWSAGKPDTLTKWGDLYQLARERLLGNETVLDIGTAEGNRFLTLLGRMQRGIGIDVSPEMIAIAQAKVQKEAIQDFQFIVMDSKILSFPDATFDWVIARHAPVVMAEVLRVLKPGGVFITQQVHETDKRNLQRAFGRGQGWGTPAGTLLHRYRTEARRHGAVSTKWAIHNAPSYFADKETLVRFLRATPTIPEFGKHAGDEGILENFIQRFQEPGGIRTNTSRFLLEVRKANIIKT